MNTAQSETTGASTRRQIICEDAIVADDWASVEDGAALPEEGDVIVSLARLQAEGSALRARAGRLGVAIAADVDVRGLDGQLDGVSLITLDFPTFRDGRAYSQASILRQMGYEGALRATGDVLQDQLFFMQRCGFNEFALREDKDPSLALKSLEPFSHFYQVATDDRVLVPDERRQDGRD